MNAVLSALQFRHACKKFDPQRLIAPEELETILECGRMSPSSFGMEPWRFVVITDAELRQQLRPACWNQAQITDCSALLVILSKPAAVQADSDYVRAIYARRGLSAEQNEAALTRYRNYLDNEVAPTMSLHAWASKQCYIALGNMMTAAASLAIDSCPIEGYEKSAVEQILGIDGSESQLAVMVALGYRAGEQTPRLRLPLAELVEYR